MTSNHSNLGFQREQFNHQGTIGGFNAFEWLFTWGRSMGLLMPTAAKASCSLLTVCARRCPLSFDAHFQQKKSLQCESRSPVLISCESIFFVKFLIPDYLIPDFFFKFFFCFYSKKKKVYLKSKYSSGECGLE